ncbi:hypothetical protein [Nonlabens marinus]|uniref:Uncharacterized protein n=1 Tax=Nonlabens marinus S1-08 TaxID=1454201 RepID=W8VVB6_9FLAO|nr:hypothetical protein [Nonlabens marinus]BAO55303.1 hypothetical protein NMS_1294 [Nonlabens marinus S1-08]
MFIYDQKNQLIGPNGAIDYFFSSFEYPLYLDLSTDFRRCDSDSMAQYRFPYGSMDYIISKIEVPNPQMLEAYTYKVFTFWNSDLPTQSENLDRSWMKMVGNFKPNESVLFVNIFTDLQEDWGLRPDGKVFYILTKMEGSDDLYVGKLSETPYK